MITAWDSYKSQDMESDNARARKMRAEQRVAESVKTGDQSFPRRGLLGLFSSSVGRRCTWC